MAIKNKSIVYTTEESDLIAFNNAPNLNLN